MPRRKQDGPAPEYLTTFMVAQALGVSPPTVVNWIESGRLPAHRTLGGHRRVARADMLVFARAFKYPLPEQFLHGTPSRRGLAAAQAAPRTRDVRADAGPSAGLVASGSAPERSAPSRGSGGAPVRLLVVDDDPSFGALAREYLELRGGFAVEVADSGFAAGYAVARFRPDVILMDIRMPGMNGVDAVRLLQADPGSRSVPVIACSGHFDASMREWLRSEPFVGHVEKPVRLDMLAELIEAVVRRAQTSA